MKTRFSLRLRPVPVLVFAVMLAAALNATAQTVNLPVVTVRAPDPSASEAGDPGRFILLRDGPTNMALNIYCVFDGTASNGVDYATIPSFILIPAGVREVPIPVVPIDDALVEGPETVVLKLVPSPLLPPVNYIIGNLSNAMVTIYDNEVTSPTNYPPTVRITSPTNGTTFCAPVDIPIYVYARDPDGAVMTVELFAGTNDLGPGNPVPVNYPTNPPCPCPLILNLYVLVWSNVPPGDYVLTAKATDDDGASRSSDPVHVLVGVPPMPLVTIVATDPLATEIPLVPPGMGMPQRIDPGEFTVFRTGSTNLPLDVFYAVGGTASNGVDYETLSGKVTIPAGAHAAPIEVSPIDDLLVEGMETVVARLTPVACITIYPPPPGCYGVGTPNEAVVYIADNDSETNFPPDAKITKPLDGQMFVAPVNIPIRAETADSDGYVDHMEFYAGTNQIGEQTRYYLTPPPPGQHAVFEMVWTNPPVGRQELRVKARDDDGAIGWSLPVNIWVVETNVPPVTNLPPIVTITAPDPIASEGTNCYQILIYPPPPTNPCGTNTATFVVRRTGPTNDALTVYYRIGGTASNGVDYVELPGVVTIPAGRRAAEFRVVPIDDALPECVETVVLGLRVPPDTASNVPPYVVGYPGRAAAIIVDNDQPRPGTGLLPDRCFHVLKPGANGTWWRIECSTDTLQWTPICTNPVIDGAIDFVDPDADELPNRFYRAVAEPNPPTDLP